METQQAEVYDYAAKPVVEGECNAQQQPPPHSLRTSTLPLPASFRVGMIVWFLVNGEKEHR